jgi:hypothetical protein
VTPRRRTVRSRPRRVARLGHALAAAIAVTAAHPALADDAPASSAAPASTTSPNRALPDYEGRPPPAPSAGEVALWVPRILFSPVWFVSEFVIRRPIGAALTAAERANLPSVLYDFFAFGPEHKVGFAPVVFVDFGFNPSVGLYFFWNDAFFKGNEFRLHASTWGEDWVMANFKERIHLTKRDTFAWGVGYTRRPDYVFYGIGPTTLQSAQSRYGEDRLDAGLLLSSVVGRGSHVETGLGLRTAKTYDGHFGDDPPVSHQIRTGVFSMPADFGSPYTIVTSRTAAAFDTRRPYPAPGSGFRVEGQGTVAGTTTGEPPASWLRWDAGAAGYLDLDGHRRILSLGAEALFADPLGSGAIPFTELVALGGDLAPMPGFFPGRLVDRSAAVATLRYRWPIGPYISGSLEAAVGNVFGEHLDGFDPKLLRFESALGIQSDMSPDSDVHILVGFGTETFDHGTQIDTVRLAFGTSRF